MNTMNVQFTDDGIDWSAAGDAPHRAMARRLLRSFEGEIVGTISGPGKWLLSRAATVLESAFGSEFGFEINGLAAALDVKPRDVLLGNLAYDLAAAVGCSTFVVDTPTGPLHARNLDWTLPGRALRDGTTAVHVEGVAVGDYWLVTWPGFFGALTAVAPGRFSVSVNYVKQPQHDTVAAAWQAMGGAWPVPWAVRHALDSCKSFDQAVRYLRSVPLISPVLFAVAGTKAGEGVVIERGPDDYAVRKMDGACVTVTNHYQSEAFEDDNLDPDELSDMLSPERDAGLRANGGCRTVRDTAAAFRVLSRSRVILANTQHQVVMGAAQPMLQVRLPGERAVKVL